MLKQRQLDQEKGGKVTWKKSASVESLHMAAGSEFVLSEEEREALRTSYTRANSVRVSRGRGCNESFRQVLYLLACTLYQPWPNQLFSLDSIL